MFSIFFYILDYTVEDQIQGIAQTSQALYHWDSTVWKYVNKKFASRKPCHSYVFVFWGSSGKWESEIPIFCTLFSEKFSTLYIALHEIEIRHHTCTNIALLCEKTQCHILSGCPFYLFEGHRLPRHLLLCVQCSPLSLIYLWQPPNQRHFPLLSE
jgi:hypothetical protein